MNGEHKPGETPLEYKLYKNFWSIQKYLNNPIQVRD